MKSCFKWVHVRTLSDVLILLVTQQTLVIDLVRSSSKQPLFYKTAAAAVLMLFVPPVVAGQRTSSVAMKQQQARRTAASEKPWTPPSPLSHPLLSQCPNVETLCTCKWCIHASRSHLQGQCCDTRLFA